MPNWKLVIVPLLVVIAIVAFKNFSTKNNRTQEVTPISRKVSLKSSPEKESLSNQIDSLGPKEAYEQFKQTVSQSSPEDQHALAHLFGGLLYQKLGKKGVAVCDSTFGFGCYHGFYILALATEGTGIIKELDKICVTDPQAGGQNCQHGLGHGLMEYFGPNKLTEALAFCQQTTRVDNVHGCAAGVFMDYNEPLLAAAGTPQVRALSGDPYQPCLSAPDEFKDACYYQISQWWAQVFNNDFKKIGQLCQQIKDENNKHSCFSGAGIAAADNNHYDPVKVVSSCESLPTPATILLCKKAAYNNFYTQTNFKDKAGIICNGLDANLTKECEGFRN